MERTPIQSSHLKEIGHDPTTNTLEVQFKNGKVYQYQHVNRSAFHQILSLPSQGEAFHRIIKTKHFESKLMK